MSENRKPGLQLQLKTRANDRRPVFVTGNFNGWLPDLREFEMQRVRPGLYFFQFPEDFCLPNPLEYKYTRGGWDSSEQTNDGQPVGNRLVESPKEQLSDYVARWGRNVTKGIKRFHSIVESFTIDTQNPSLKGPRTVTVLLPANYYENTAAHYPVLYMMDGQNLLGGGSAYGNWAVDVSLENLGRRKKREIILVVVNHGEEDRVHEFSPYNSRRMGKGRANEFLQFLTQVLKPKIDTTYRTLADRTHTGIGGSSMGGLFALYAAAFGQQVFGKVMSFSPSLWISPRVFGDLAMPTQAGQSAVYLYSGGKEGGRTLQNTQMLFHILEEKSRFDSRLRATLSVNPKGQHKETYWKKEFPKALEWLYFS